MRDGMAALKCLVGLTSNLQIDEVAGHPVRDDTRNQGHYLRVWRVRQWSDRSYKCSIDIFHSLAHLPQL
jgi:hypothetical protein